MVLWVLERNEHALKFYQKHGFVRDGASKYDARLGANEIRLQVTIP
jgi:ribosomal protein S18 acetylase RimI-like enzyme